ncbi:MAG: GNAT family N-acetyltransferase [Candidatus Latescibacteria bacterium]|nr:GNAT family N-acetyltransferase [Candidatus Latescibacterota bacterium]
MLAERFRLPRSEALALLARAHVVQVAGVGPDGAPLLRTLHAALVPGDDGDALVWHGSHKGEKSELVGRPLAIAAHETLAEIPSHFVDPERACPATTYYESVQATGVAEDLVSPGDKARALQALMEKYQPEGGHRPLTGDDPLYTADLKGTRVLRMPIATLAGKSKLGQNRSPAQRARIVERLWERGAPGDLTAVDRILAGNPDTPCPGFLAAPAGARLLAGPPAALAPAAAALLEGAYWTVGETPEALAAAHRRSDAWVAAVDAASGELLASGRVLGDGLRVAWLLDVVVRPDWRGRGLGSAIVRLLVDHPRARGARELRLRTRDAQNFYARFGFQPLVPGEEAIPTLRRAGA